MTYIQCSTYLFEISCIDAPLTMHRMKNGGKDVFHFFSSSSRPIQSHVQVSFLFATCSYSVETYTIHEDEWPRTQIKRLL